MKIPELQKLLSSLNVTPSRKLGQNFLMDDSVAQWIVDQLDIRPSDTVVEIGPGTGALTTHIVGRPRKLILIEKDRHFAEHLRQRYVGHDGHFEVIHADAAQYDARPLFKEGKVKLIGNLPYSAATPILENFMDPPSPIEMAVVMIQKEVAERICAGPRTKQYGVLSVIMQRRWVPTLLKTVGPTLFYPRPEVDSTIIKLEQRDKNAWPLHCPQTFKETVKKGFAQRRKQLHNNLALESGEWAAVAGELKLETTARAEELSVRQWIDLSNQFDDHPGRNLPPSAGEPLDVVDRNDLFLEKVCRSEVHKRNLLHRAVHVFLFNKAGEIYLQKRSHLKDTHGEKWDSSASGHLDAGETYSDAAVRELSEELAVQSPVDLELVAKLEAGPGTDNEFVELYRCEFNGRIKTHGSEIDCGGFFTLEEVADWLDDRPGDFATGFLTCFRHFLVNRCSK